MNYPKNIIIYRLGSLGDTIIALPTFRALRRAFPQSKITLLTNRPVSSKAAPVESVLGKGSFFDEVLEYPVGTRNPLTLLALIRSIRHRNINLAVNLAAYRSDFTTIRDKYFFYTAGVRNFAGFDLKPSDKSSFAIRNTGETEWEAIRIARRVKDITSIDLDDSSNWDLRLSESEIQRGLELIAPLRPSNRLIAFSMGTKVPANDWGLQNWASP